MSYPLNPLDDFRTYSYHHILMASVTTETLKPFMVASNSPTAADTEAAALTAILNTTPGDPIIVGNAEAEQSPYLILDSRRTSGIAIRDVSYSTTPGTGAANQTHIITGEVNVVIVDADGIVFINFLEYLMDVKFKSNYFGVTFLLKTIFTGHKSDGTVETITTSAIPLILSDMTIDVTSKEGVYTCKFIPSSQNAATVDRIDCLSDIKNVKAEDGKLSTLIKNFESALNKASRKIYEKQVIRQQEQGSPQVVELNKKAGRLVQYMITIPPEWESFKMTHTNNSQSRERLFKAHNDINYQKTNQTFSLNNQITDIETQHAEKEKVREKEHTERVAKQQQEQASKGISPGNTPTSEKFLSLPATASVYEILSRILRACDSVNALGSREKIEQTQEVVLYKTLSSLTSNTEVIVLHYDIVAYSVPNITLTKQQDEQKWFVIEGDRKTPVNSLEFDYIFSGKNTDIIDLSIKTTTAQILLSTDPKASTDAKRYVQNQKSQDNEQKIEEKINLTPTRENSPILTAPKTPDQQSNYASSSEQLNADEQRLHRRNRDEWLKTVSNLHGMSNVNLRFSIRGNPALLNKYVIDYMPSHVVDNNIKIAEASRQTNFVDTNIVGSETTWSEKKKEYRTQLDKYLKDNIFDDIKKPNQTSDKTMIHGPKAHKFPFFVKVNIFAPNRIELGSYSMNLNDSGNQYTKFWYDGWYFVQAIDNKFSDGIFTQELLVMAYDLFGDVPQSNEKPEIKKETVKEPPVQEQPQSINIAQGGKLEPLVTGRS